VLVPASAGVAEGESGTAEGADGAAPTWVFPFDRPLPPGEGDNQALAINTEDGSVQYDVTFALVWADEDTVVNGNEAYAFASCRDCRTVAVAFQVVLVVGSADVVVPQNLAGAVNYACLECVTYALATQLVVTVPGPLGEAGMQELAAIWEELRVFGEQIEDVPLADLRDRLTAFEARILDVVRENTPETALPDGGSPETGTTEDGTSDAGDGTSDAGTAGDAGTTDADPATSTGTPGATDGANGSAEPTDGATGADPSEPASDPTTDPAAGSTAEAGTTATASPSG
jgi:putative peptide zinc metalloprotease protein